MSGKTGGCPEDCHFCSQSAHFDSPVRATPLLDRGRAAGRGRGDGPPGGVGVLHRAGRAGARRAHPGPGHRDGPADPGAHRARTWPPAWASSPPTRPGAWPTPASTATTTTWRRPGRSSRRSSPPTRGRSASTPAGWCGTRGWSCAAAPSWGWGRPTSSAWSCWPSCGRWARPRCRSTSSTPVRARRWPGGRWWSRWRPSAGSPCSAWPCPSVTLRYAGGREVTLRELQALGLTVGHQRPHRRQLPHHPRPPAGAGPPAPGRPPHAGAPRADRGRVTARGTAPAADGQRAGCDGTCLGALDPPRFCRTCGRRLVVRVFPAHVESRCPAGVRGIPPPGPLGSHRPWPTTKRWRCCPA